MTLAESLESLADLLEAKKSTLKRTLLVAAYLSIDKRGKPQIPVPIMEGDELRLQPNHLPGAGTISRDPTGQPFGVALEALAAGLTREIDGEVYEKRWIVDGNPCEECEENGLAGWIPMDEPYPNDAEAGDLHPNCKCSEITRRGR
jgi:hypothetical protein